MRRDVRKFCRGCLNCVTRRGPSRLHRPPLMPIPVKGPFHRVAVDVLLKWQQIHCRIHGLPYEVGGSFSNL